MTRKPRALIKRVQLAVRKAGLGPDEFSRRWRDVVAAAAMAPEAARPDRAAVSVALSDVDGEQRYDGVALEWFASEEHLLRYEAWLAAPDSTARARLLGEAAEVDASPVVVADEHVARGADWMEGRWRDGGPKLKQMAIATRAAGLTLPQFLDRWRGRAGKIGATPIPEAHRGLAYVQNHPRIMAGRDWAYDAINEVYFDDVENLLARMAYFERKLAGSGEDDLVGANWFLAVREEPVALPGPGRRALPAPAGYRPRSSVRPGALGCGMLCTGGAGRCGTESRRRGTASRYRSISASSHS